MDNNIIIYSAVSQYLQLNDLKGSVYLHSVSPDQFRQSVVAAAVTNSFTRS